MATTSPAMSSGSSAPADSRAGSTMANSAAATEPTPLIPVLAKPTATVATTSSAQPAGLMSGRLSANATDAEGVTQRVAGGAAVGRTRCQHLVQLDAVALEAERRARHVEAPHLGDGQAGVGDAGVPVGHQVV